MYMPMFRPEGVGELQYPNGERVPLHELGKAWPCLACVTVGTGNNRRMYRDTDKGHAQIEFMERIGAVI